MGKIELTHNVPLETLFPLMMPVLTWDYVKARVCG